MEIAFVCCTILPGVFAQPRLLVLLILAFICVGIDSFIGFPHAFAMSHAIQELTMIYCTIGPFISALATETTHKVLTFVAVSITVDLTTKTLLQAILEGSLVLFDTLKGKLAESIFFTIFPLPVINHAIWLFESTFAMSEALKPLSHVVISLDGVYNTKSLSLPVYELSLINVV